MRVLHNLLDFIHYDILYGIKNLIRWFPIIWRDRDWDWVFLAEMMEYKLRRMSENLNKNVRGEDARQCLLCAELLKRLRADDISDKRLWYIHEIRMDEWQKMLGRYLGKYLRNWWD